MPFNGLNMNLSNLSRLSNAETRAISPENTTGKKGRGGMATEGTGAACARELGRGWKISPSIVVPAGKTAELANYRWFRCDSTHMDDQYRCLASPDS